MAVDAVWILDLAASLPESGERDYRDGATIFTFRGRAIGYVSADGRELYVKSTLAEREALVRSRPDVFSQWFTSGRYGWVRVRLEEVDRDEARELVVDAWRLTAPQRMVRDLDERRATLNVRLRAGPGRAGAPLRVEPPATRASPRAAR